MAHSQYETGARIALGRNLGRYASAAALAAIKAEEAVDGALAQIADGAGGSVSNWIFSATSTATDSTSQLAIAPTDGYAGAWLRTDKLVDLKMAVDQTTADAAVLFTVPAGFRIRPTRAFWEVVTGFTGGTSSAIGLSSDNSAYSTAGDLLGGSGGDVAATLVSTSPGPFVGTIGSKTAGACVLVATNKIKFNRIASNFTAGAGYAHVPVELVN